MYNLIALMCLYFVLTMATEEGFRPSKYSVANNTESVDEKCTIKQMKTDLPLEMKQFVRLTFLAICAKYNLPKDVLYNAVQEVRAMYDSYSWLGIMNADFLMGTGFYMRVNLANNDMVIFAIRRG